MLAMLSETLSYVWLVEVESSTWQVFFRGHGLVGTLVQGSTGRYFDKVDPSITYNSQELAVLNIVAQAMEGTPRV